VADELSEWARPLGNGFFLEPDATVVPSPSLRSAPGPTAGSMCPRPRAPSSQGADYYLVSQAHAGSHTVVTHEVPSASTRGIKIPMPASDSGLSA